MSTPTPEQLRAARHKRFDNSISHHTPDKQARLKASYVKQDARREKNVTSFVKEIRGTK